MGKKRIYVIVAIGVSMVMLIGGLVTGIAVVGIQRYNRWMERQRGLPRDETVRFLKTELQSLSGPEAAASQMPDADVLRFRDGSWIVIVGIDGHSVARAKDTVVLRESRGPIRAFVGGHVCGTHSFRGLDRHHPHANIDEFVVFILTNWGFQEYQLPEERDDPAKAGN